MTAPTDLRSNDALPGTETDEFDFDFRITVLADPNHPEASFSNWLTCKGTCVMACTAYQCTTGKSVSRCC
jgi:hypothetical protein